MTEAMKQRGSSSARRLWHGHSDTGHQNEDGRGNSHANNIILHLKDWNKEEYLNEHLTQHKVLLV